MGKFNTVLTSLPRFYKQTVCVATINLWENTASMYLHHHKVSNYFYFNYSRKAIEIIFQFRMMLVVLLALLPVVTRAYFADWSLLARDREPTCVDIPQNMTLCHNIGEINN